MLKELIDAGLGSLPGGGAEIFHPEVREQICGAKASTESWLNVHRTAHRLGLHSNATMLYGHIDGPKHRIDHLVRLRELQDETGGFQTFIPLAFHPDNSQMAHIPKPSGVMDLKVMAISRLMLDNFPHIKAYWVMLGLKTAQVALSFGADDLDGTVVHEKIYHEAGAETPQEATVAEIRRLITEAGRIPVERDTLYHRVERDSGSWTAREHIDVPALLAGRGRTLSWRAHSSSRCDGSFHRRPARPPLARSADARDRRRSRRPDPSPGHLELPEENGEIVENFRETPQSAIPRPGIWPILERLHPDRHFALGQDCGIYWQADQSARARRSLPDWFYVPGVPPDLDGHYRRSYVLWKEHVSPTVIIEYASDDGESKRDQTPYEGKFWIYEQVVHGRLLRDFRGRDGRAGGLPARRRPAIGDSSPNTRGHYPIEPLGVELGVWHGFFWNEDAPWLRWYDTTGTCCRIGRRTRRARTPESREPNAQRCRRRTPTSRANSQAKLREPLAAGRSRPSSRLGDSARPRCQMTDRKRNIDPRRSAACVTSLPPSA